MSRYDLEKFLVPNGDLEKQKEYTELVRTVIGARFTDKPKAFVHTYGCQGNVSDGERIKGILADCGFCMTDELSEADLVLYNTCAVREHAQDRVFGNVGALKKYKTQNRNMKICLCGCMVQQPHVTERIKRSYPFVDLVFGTHVSHRLPEFLYRIYCLDKKVYEIEQSDGVIAEGTPVLRDSTFKAWIPIMYGCNNFCSYCIVPYVRGRERSRSSQAILDEVRSVVKEGYKEITLLGQNVNSYSGDMNFAGLLRAINDIEGDFIIRFMTSHPKDCTHELIDTIAECEKVERHLHLPFQSGNDRILKEMNRKYDREKYLELVNYAKKRIPDVLITSDVIVGFPSETDEEFEDTLSLAREVRFSSLFLFIYSPREGTVAARMEDNDTHETKVKRFKKLEKLQADNSSETASEMVGKTYRVLCDSVIKDGVLSGKTSTAMAIEFDGSNDLLGTFVNVRITERSGWSLKGEVVR
ncbi:MAG: tRNA (N6-isopentenyl adenosine(37)-C2)-methylthiotransferase MiaB [Clostridia bacterium]|nr:tRNA (N6-isopentenyl adenosine(37)-C2)-methylthiotransferase MiaB [Clostridia bacterium]